MSIKTFCSAYCKFHDNVFVRSYPLRLLQPFDGKLEIRNNHFVEDLTPAEAAAKFLPGVHFGPAGDFPTWLRDPDRVVIKPGGSHAYRGSRVSLVPVFDGSVPEIRYTLDGSAPKAQSPLYRDPLRLTSPDTILAQPFHDGRPSGAVASATFAQLLEMPDVFLDELPLASMKSGNEQPERKTQLRKNCIGKPLRLGGVTYERGIGDHAGHDFAAELVYALRPEYRRFVSLAGVDDQTDHRGSLRVQVYVDDQLKAKTPILRGGQMPYYFDLEMPRGAKQLRVVIDDAGDGYAYDDADFVNAGFLVSAPH